MSSMMEVLQYSPDLLEPILADIEGEAAKSAARGIIEAFDKNGLTIKVKHIFPTKPAAYFRVLCFIKKSKEAVIINTKNDLGPKGVIPGMNIQLRIENGSTLVGLDEFTENIRSTIINGNDCCYCSEKCKRNCSVFTYNGINYVKCQFICSNFRFHDIEESDISDLLYIVNGEIEYKQKSPKPAR